MKSNKQEKCYALRSNLTWTHRQSKYMQYLPTEEELIAEIEREKLHIRMQLETGGEL